MNKTRRILQIVAMILGAVLAMALGITTLILLKELTIMAINDPETVAQTIGLLTIAVFVSVVITQFLRVASK